ncbi:lysophospholipid acyltransferase family protein [Jatrophihabitans sp. YIM 134969]
MTARPDRTYRAVIAAFHALYRAADLRVEVRGAENIPTTGPAVLAANHVGYLDFTLVGLAAERRGRLVRFMAKRSTFTNPVSGPLMRRMGHIPVERDGVLAGAVAYRRAIRALEAGELVGVFPESTISRSWTLREFKPGAAALAVRQQVPLIPVVTWGGHRVASVDGHVRPERHVPVTVLVGAPVTATTRDETGTLLRAAIQELLDTAQREYPVDGAGRWWQPLHLDGMAPTRAEAAELEREADLRARAGR